MLPSSPLHHLLLRQLNFPVVATSGNLSEEPICIDESEAIERLRGIADGLLVHNRPIVRHVDDSILRVLHGREMMLRRARGYAPLPVTLERSLPAILALGAHLKNTVALSVARNVFVSQHIGDLATRQAYDAFTQSAADLPRLYDAEPELIAHDLHPEYLSTKHALQQPARAVAVQHHWAHIASCMRRDVPWDRIVGGALPFLITRQIFAGAGKMGIEAEGAASQPGTYQISQRADFFSVLVSIDTMSTRG